MNSSTALVASYYLESIRIFPSCMKKRLKFGCICSYTIRRLDRPSTHRFLELCLHSMPLYGHKRIIFDLTFDTDHQTLESGISKCTSRSSHHSAVHQVLAKNWFSRIYDTHRMASPLDGSVNKYAKPNLQKLPYGFDELSTGLDIESSITSHSSAKNIVDLSLSSSPLESFVQEHFSHASSPYLLELC